MKTHQTKRELRDHLDQVRSTGGTVGFIPTMGALHEGHISLVRASGARHQENVVSIFVNPTQFNNAQDLALYPRTVEADIELLRSSPCSVVFLPSAAEVYPDGQTSGIDYDPGILGRVLEGEHRPGHFKGVVQVVRRLFQAVGPCSAYFGLKDYQQFKIIEKMIQDLNLEVSIQACAIVRDPDGLAMSSRNQRLTAAQRDQALAIPRVLNSLGRSLREQGLEAWRAFREKSLRELTLTGLQVEYLELRHLDLLSPAENLEESIILIAAWAGEVRLIDNIILGQD